MLYSICKSFANLSKGGFGMSSRKRLTAWLLACLILFVTLVSGFEIACEAHHVCVGEECRVCAHITIMRALLKTVSLAVVGTWITRAVCRARCVANSASRGISAISPVCLRVRLLN